MKRLAHVDIMKAIGIVLVVVGHAPGLNAFTKNVIYSFHMPLFFFISGLLLSEQKLSLAYKPYLAFLWKWLGLPYLFFFLLSYLYWLPTHHLSASADKYEGLSWWAPLTGALIGNGDALFVNVVLWYFTCLLTTALIYFAARKSFSPGFLFIAFNLLGFIFTLTYDASWPRLPWGLDNAVVAIAFYASGQYFRPAQDLLLGKLSKNGAMGLSLVLFAGVVFFARLNGAVDLNTLHFGDVKPLFFLSAYLGIFALFFLSLALKTNGIFQWLSQNSLVIFPTHLLMFGVFTGVAVAVFGLPANFKETASVWTVLFPALALALSYPTSWFFHRFFSKLFGARAAPKQAILLNA